MNKARSEVHHMVSYGPDSSLLILEVFVYLVIHTQMSAMGSLWWEVPVFAGSSRKALAIFQKKGISLVYLQAFQECMHVIVVSATTHLTTATTF